MKKSVKRFALAVAALLSFGTLYGCGTPTPPAASPEAAQTQAAAPAETKAAEPATTAEAATEAPAAGPDTSEAVNLVYYLWGSEGPANKDILAAINEKLKADINATLEVKYIDWGDIATKYPLLFASGEEFDMSHASPGAVISMFKLAADEALVDITDMLPTVAPALQKEIPEDVWAGAKVNGRIIGVPTLYTEFTPYSFVTRRDLATKYGTAPVTDIATMEAYLAKAKETEQFAPLNGDATLAQTMYRTFVALTGTYVEAPGIPSEQPYLVASSNDNYADILHPAFTPEFEEWCVRMKDWSDKGYFPKDALSAKVSAKDNFLNGQSAAYIAHMPDWTGAFGTMKEKQPGVEVDAWTFAESTGKIIRMLGVQNSTIISKTSKHPERALMAIEKFMTDESYYRLIQNGLEGRSYVIKDGKIEQPEGYNPENDGGGFAVWSLRNDRFNLPLGTEDPRRYELIDKWKGTAIPNMYVGFTPDLANITTELASIANVNAELGKQLLLGKAPGDVKEAVKKYQDQLKQAGVEKVVAEIKGQLEKFTPVGK